MTTPMPPEDNPMDEVQITKEEWQAGELARLEGEVADLENHACAWASKCGAFEGQFYIEKSARESAESRLKEVEAERAKICEYLQCGPLEDVPQLIFWLTERFKLAGEVAEAVAIERSLCKLFKEAYVSWEPDGKILALKRKCDEAVAATDAALSRFTATNPEQPQVIAESDPAELLQSFFPQPNVETGQIVSDPFTLSSHDLPPGIEPKVLGDLVTTSGPVSGPVSGEAGVHG